MTTRQNADSQDYTKWCSLCEKRKDRHELVTGAVQSICNECLAQCENKTVKDADAHCVGDASSLCSFCGPNKSPVYGTKICSECINLAKEVLAERKNES